MFGRLRPPPSTPDSLERYPPKIIKHDPLSVYESTLLKLKQGSKLDISEGENLTSSANSVQASDVCSATQGDTHDAMAIDLSSGQCEQLENKSPSVLSMFCNYKKARNLSYTVDITTETENGPGTKN